MIRLCKCTVHFLWKTLLIFICVAGVFVASLRLFLPTVANYHDEIEQFIADKLNRKVQIERISAKMHHFWPELTLTGISIKNQQNETALYIKQAWASISVFHYLKNQQLVLNRLALSGMSLHIRRNLAENIQIAGFDIQLNPNNKQNKKIINHLKIPENIEILNTTIFWKDEIKKIQHRFNHFNLHLDRQKYAYDGSLQFKVASQPNSQPIKALLKFNFKDQYNLLFNGRSMLSLQAIDFKKTFKQFNIQWLKEMTLDFDLWIDWQNAQPTKIIGTFNHQKIQLKQPLTIDQFAGGFEIIKKQNLWQLSLQTDKLIINQQPFHVADLLFYYRYQAKQHQLSMYQDHFDLTLPQFLAKHLKIKEKFLPDLGLKGSLDKFHLLAISEDNKPPLWQLSTNINHLKIKNWLNYPAIGDIQGHLLLQPDYAALDLNIKQGIFYWPNMLRSPINLNQIKGRFIFKKWRDGWSLNTDHFVLNTDDIETISRLNIFKPMLQSPYIDWQTHFKKLHAQNIPAYYPTKVLSPTLIKWLDTAIIKAEIPRGFVLFRGQTSDYPFHKNQAGHFEVAFDVEAGELAYAPKFPSIKNLQGTVRFLDNGLKFENASGTTYDATLSQVSGKINAFKISDSMQIDGKIEGQLSTYKKFLIETPLKKYLASGLTPLAFKNTAIIDLKLDVPLKKDVPFHFESLLHLKNNTLSVINQNIHLTDINGHVLISDKLVKGKKITAKLNGYPITVNAHTQKDGSTQIKGAGKLALNNFLNTDLKSLNDNIKGKSNWHLLLNIPASKMKQTTTLTLTSNLIGMQSTLPQPFNKNKAEIKAFKFSLPLGEGLARLNYDQLLFGLFKINKTGLYQGNLRLHKKASLPELPVLLFDGKLSRINLDKWINFGVKMMPSNSTKKSKKNRPFIATNLTFENVIFMDKKQGYCQFLIKEKATQWQMNTKSDNIEGQMNWFKNQQKLQINLKKLSFNLPKISEKSDSKTRPTIQKQVVSSINPQNLPHLELNIDQLFINKQLFGGFELKSNKIPRGLNIEKIKVDGYLLNILAHGQWLQSFTKQNEITLKGQFNTEHFGKILSTFMQKPPLSKGTATIDIDMTWHKSINQLSAVNGQGKMQINLKDGHLDDVDAGNAGRLINLLNLGGLIRKVQLNVDNKKGFDFEKIAGTLLIDQEQVTTSNLLLESNPADVEISGHIQMTTETIDLTLAITPHLSSTVPLAAAIVGGPAAGVVALIAERALGKQVDSMSKIKYFATGTLKEIKLKRENFLDRLKPITDYLK